MSESAAEGERFTQAWVDTVSTDGSPKERKGHIQQSGTALRSCSIVKENPSVESVAQYHPRKSSTGANSLRLQRNLDKAVLLPAILPDNLGVVQGLDTSDTNPCSDEWNFLKPRDKSQKKDVL